MSLPLYIIIIKIVSLFQEPLIVIFNQSAYRLNLKWVFSQVDITSYYRHFGTVNSWISVFLLFQFLPGMEHQYRKGGNIQDTTDKWGLNFINSSGWGWIRVNGDGTRLRILKLFRWMEEIESLDVPWRHIHICRKTSEGVNPHFPTMSWRLCLLTGSWDWPKNNRKLGFQP